MKDWTDKNEYYKNKNKKKTEEVEVSSDYMYYPLEESSDKENKAPRTVKGIK